MTKIPKEIEFPQRKSFVLRKNLQIPESNLVHLYWFLPLKWTLYIYTFLSLLLLMDMIKTWLRLNFRFYIPSTQPPPNCGFWLKLNFQFTLVVKKCHPLNSSQLKYNYINLKFYFSQIATFQLANFLPILKQSLWPFLFPRIRNNTFKSIGVIAIKKE